MADPVKKAAAKKAEPEPEEKAPAKAEPAVEIVGESRPELFVPSKPGRVVPKAEPAPEPDEGRAGGYVNRPGLGWVLEEE